MPSIKAITKKFKAYTVPVVILKNEAQTIEVGGKLQRNANTLVNYWDLITYEVQGNPTEIIGPKGLLGKKVSGVGYLCDEQGVTVSLERNGPRPQGEEPPTIVFNTMDYLEFRFHSETVPYILIQNNGMTVTWGGQIRKKGPVLTNGPGQPVYFIKNEMVEIFNVATGKSEMGYICDEAGVTVDIKRDFRVTYPDPFDESKKAEIEKRNKAILEGTEVGVKIKFSGGIGKLASFDRIPEIFDVGQSKKNLWFGIVIGLAIMFIISRFV